MWTIAAIIILSAHSIFHSLSCQESNLPLADMGTGQIDSADNDFYDSKNNSVPILDNSSSGTAILPSLVIWDCEMINQMTIHGKP